MMKAMLVYQNKIIRIIKIIMNQKNKMIKKKHQKKKMKIILKMKMISLKLKKKIELIIIIMQIKKIQKKWF